MPAQIVMTPTPKEIVLVWSTHWRGKPLALHFARLDQRLRVLTRHHASLAGERFGTGYRTSMAATRAGWLIAAGERLFVASANGLAPVRRVRGTHLQLVSGAAGLLLVWHGHGSGTFAERVRANGSRIDRPTFVSPGKPAAIVAVGKRFLLAQLTAGGIAVAQLRGGTRAAGKLLRRTQIAKGSWVSAFTRFGQQVRLISSGRVYRLGLDGAPLGAPRVLSQPIGSGVVVDLGRDVIVTTREDRRLVLERVTPSGHRGQVTLAVALAPSTRTAEALVVEGQFATVAFAAGGGVRVVRVELPTASIAPFTRLAKSQGTGCVAARTPPRPSR